MQKEVPELAAGKKKTAKKELWPKNSIQYFRKRAGLTLPQLAERTRDMSYRVTQAVEARNMELTADYADQLGRVLGIPASYLAYPGYPWATQLMPVVGSIGPGLQVEMFSQPRGLIGAFKAVSETTMALAIQPGIPPFSGWFVLVDDAAREPISQSVIDRQTMTDAKFITRLANGSIWFRMIGPGSRPGLYHLYYGSEYLPDVEIEWVSEVVDTQTAKPLPPLAV